MRRKILMFPHTDNSFTNGTIYTNPPKINKKVHKDISIDVKATKTQMTILTWKDKNSMHELYFVAGKLYRNGFVNNNHFIEIKITFDEQVNVAGSKNGCWFFSEGKSITEMVEKFQLRKLWWGMSGSINSGRWQSR